MREHTNTYWRERLKIAQGSKFGARSKVGLLLKALTEESLDQQTGVLSQPFFDRRLDDAFAEDPYGVTVAFAETTFGDFLMHEAPGVYDHILKETGMNLSRSVHEALIGFQGGTFSMFWRGRKDLHDTRLKYVQKKVDELPLQHFEIVAADGSDLRELEIRMKVEQHKRLWALKEIALTRLRFLTYVLRALIVLKLRQQDEERELKVYPRIRQYTFTGIEHFSPSVLQALWDLSQLPTKDGGRISPDELRQECESYVTHMFRQLVVERPPHEQRITEVAFLRR